MPVIASAAALGIWGIVAHDAGAGWVQSIGALVAGALVVGALAPAAVVARVRCRCVAAPYDASAGIPVTLEIWTSAPVELHPIDPPGPATTTRRRGSSTLDVRPEHRGVVDRCTLTLASAAPFGILWWTRTVVLTLPHPLAVAPRVGVSELRPRDGRSPADTPLGAPGRGDDPRGIRPYERGDRRTLVHWPATAHTGSLMVRESERPGPLTAVVDGRLPTDPSEAEHQAEHVMAEVHALLRSGARVELETTEPEGHVVAPVTTLHAAGRRLALALPRVGASCSHDHAHDHAHDDAHDHAHDHAHDATRARQEPWVDGSP
ncbi:MAG: DUF58 domain-containing protein [Actinomycetota bacterium]|nr:DUF58 domain-containing protein [Actinomycetota bacterium]